MGNSRFKYQTSMGSKNSRRSLQYYRKLLSSWVGCGINDPKNNQYRKSKHFAKYLLAVSFLFISPVKANTVSSPSASSSGTVINNGYQTINGNFPTHRYSQGIQCQLPTLAITPFVTKGENFSLPRVTTTRTNIYDLSEDADGNLLNPGRILYQSEQPRLDQTVYNLNYGITASFQIPLGGRGFNKACLKAAETQIKGQEFALQKARLEANLARMKVCAEQFKLGVKLIGEDAISCKNVVLTTIPNQVIPHTHKLR